MDCSKRSAGAAAGLPDDPLVEILSRVPAKSVCRFKCVSKAWRDLIADPHNRKKLRQAMEGLFCNVSPIGISFIDLTARSVPLDIDPCFSFLTELPEFRSLRLLDSCNGLVLLEHGAEPYSEGLGYIVCNPTTKEWEAVALPTCGSDRILNYTYLAFDPTVSSHFHLVQFQVKDQEDFISLHAYSSETGTWSQNQVEEQDEEGELERWHQVSFIPGNLRPQCPFVNGFLHLAVSDRQQVKIVALDVQGKARRMITVPQAAGGHWMCYLGEAQGHLHYMTQDILNIHEEKYELCIWVLQDYDTQEWVLKDTLNNYEVFGENSYRSGMMEFQVANIHQDCNMIFFTDPFGELVAYDMGRKEMRVIATSENQKNLIDTGRYVPYFSELPVLTNKHR